MDFDYWERLERPRTSFTVYATYQPSRTSRNNTSGNVNSEVHLDDQEELDSIRSICRNNGEKFGSYRTLASPSDRGYEGKMRLHRISNSSLSNHMGDNTAAAAMSSSMYCSSSYSPDSPYSVRNTSPGPMPGSSPSFASPSLLHHQQSSEAVCAVCGDGHAKLHYGVLACYGCKGFFRRTLTGKYRYVCRFGNNCIVDKFQRNSCRCCRFQRCLEVGMDPKAVRPDRDLTGRQKVPRVRKRAMDEELLNHMLRLQGDDWSRKIPVEAKMLLMQLLNIESKVAKGDSSLAGPLPAYSDTTPLGVGMAGMKNVSLKELFEQKPSSTRRTEMCYEPYRMARAEELPKIAHRGAIAAVDWVESLDELIEAVVLTTADKIALVKACYAPLTIFNFSARTAQNTRNPDILCLCSYSYVPRKLPADFNGSNHLSNNLIDRTLNELVSPLRKLALREEEVVALKAIVILDPNAKNLSAEAQREVAEMRDRVQDMLFQVVKELHPSQNAASRFGNLLLLLPTITTLSGLMCENMQFCQVFGWTDPLLNELFEPNDDKTDGSEPFSFFNDCGGGGTMPISYSPPMLGESQCNPADISLHLHGEQQQPSPSSLPRHLTSSSRQSSPSSSSLSNSFSSPSPSKADIEKCESSTQTDECGFSAAAASVPSFEFDQSSRCSYDHQDGGAFITDSPFQSLFDMPGNFNHNHKGHNHQDQIDIEFSATDSLLFDTATSSNADLFGLMQ